MNKLSHHLEMLIPINMHFPIGFCFWNGNPSFFLSMKLTYAFAVNTPDIITNTCISDKIIYI